MDESYPIEVLHIVNPHVIFVESQGRKGVPLIQQVGIYGVVPVNKTIDIDGEVVAERCENWPVAANATLREFLADHTNRVYFVPIQVEERSTIFDDNIHQFGDIIIKAGKTMSIIDHLIKVSAAVKDECAFHEKLASGSLKTKLNTVRTEEVLNAIKKYYQNQKKVEHDWQKTINKQTTLYQASKKITAELTEANLQIFERNSHCKTNVMRTIERKENDLNLCKDADMLSAGCGIRRNRAGHPNSSTPVKQSKGKEEHKLHDILNNMKKYVDANCQTKSLSDCDNFEHSSKYDEGELSTPSKDKYEKDHKHQNENRVPHHKYSSRDQQQKSRQKTYNQNANEVSHEHKCDIQNKNRKRYQLKDDQSEIKLHSQQTFYNCDEQQERKIYWNNSGNYQDNNQSSSEVSEKSHKQRINPSQCEKKASQHQGSTKQATSPMKPRERRYVFCPDMEMSNENMKAFVPVTVLEECTMNNPKTTTHIKESEDISVYPIGNTKIAVNNSENHENNEIQPQKSHTVTQNFAKTSTAKTNRDTQLASSILQRKLQALKDAQKRQENSISSNSDTSVKDTSSSAEQSKNELETSKIELKTSKNVGEQSKFEPESTKIEFVEAKLAENLYKVERNVNPFKNLDGSKSVFVDKLISPILMVHTKNDNLILPQCDLRDIPFKQDIHCMLKNMRVHKPKRLQTVSWSYILRGHSVFMIGPASNGKTLGYVPAVCNLVIDSKPEIEGRSPICVIVCATSLSVSQVETYCQRFCSPDQRIVTFFSGVELTKTMTALLNGCHVLICTAPALVSLLEADFGVDLRRLMVLVFDDCERLSQVYASELKQILLNVKKILKKRADKSLKVQYVVASRQWCDFMTPLAKKAPDTVIAIGASQECVLYSKTKTSVNFVKSKMNKVNSVIEFLETIDRSKRMVVICRDDDEVDLLDETLTKLKHTVFSCNSTMTLHDLYKLNDAWANYQELILGPILICCDGNLTHLNITNASYLVHFSMPPLFSLFCKRFSVLNENYASIFGPENENMKIKILLDETNVEQLPKILHFVKRCTNETVPMLDNVLQDVLKDKDFKKAENLNPICDILMMFGECIDVFTCPDRHTFFKEFDEPQDWIPKQGVITFKIMHYDSAVTYSAKLLARLTKTGNVKYPNNYNTLSLKMGMYYSKESNRKLHGIPKVGDVCAVAIKQNFFERCKIMRVFPSDNKNSSHVLINLIDKEELTVTTDVYLYYLPNDLKAIETFVVKIRLANIQPKDKDVTFSLAAQNYLQKTTYGTREDIVYMRGKVVLTVGNCIFVDTAEACIDLSSVGETVVKRDFKKDLLIRHADPNPQHIEKLKKIAGSVITDTDENELEVKSGRPPKAQKSSNWAHLDKDDFSTVIFAAALDAGTIFVRHAKFQKVINLLLRDIEEYVEKASELAREEIYVGNIVLAEFPDDKMYERARIDEVMNDNTVNCFFVDNGDWRQVSVQKLKPITESIIKRIPFQAIECRLVGVKPPGNASDWPEFSTNWLYDNCFDDSDGNTKYLFVKYFTKEKATVTGGHKYGVVLFDTNSNEDVVINKMMVDLNLAKEIEDESKYIEEPLNAKSVKPTVSSSDEEDAPEVGESDKATPIVKDLLPFRPKEKYENEESTVPLSFLLGKPIRSVPLVNDSDSDVSDKWDVNVDKDMIGMFGQPSQSNILTDNKSDKFTNIDFGISNITKEANVVRCLQKTEQSKEISQQMPETPNVESRSDSDDTDIENENVKQLDNLNNKLFKNEVTEISLNNVGLAKHEENLENNDRKKNTEIWRNETLDSDDLSSAVTETRIPEGLGNTIDQSPAVEPPRKPKLVWRQNNNTITLKINLIGVENYKLDIKERYLRFQTWHNDTTYEFDFELYGVVVPKKCVHSNKGQYIQVTLIKMLHRNWLNLTKECTAKKWIVYDVDAIDFSTDEDEDNDAEARKVIKHNHEKEDSASEDEDFVDDMSFRYKKH